MTYNRSVRLGALIALMTVLVAALFTSTASAARGERAPLLNADNPNAVSGQYLVVLKDNPLTTDRALANRTVDMMVTRYVDLLDGKLIHTYDSAVVGFYAQLSDRAVDALRNNSRVAYVEADLRVSLVGDQVNPPAWGLDRVDQRNLPMDNNYHYDYTGAGVHSYTIDTGLNGTHVEFTGRVGTGYNAVGSNTNNWTDCNGHGTHVTGTIGGTTFGVAKDVTVHGVRVLGCLGFGNTGNIVEGIDWVAANAISPAVANMSLGGSASNAMDNATSNLIASGVQVSLAAGNSDANACNTSPARVPEGVTVGATDDTDTRASFSNFGSCLDIFAPGVGILSAVDTSNTATATYSGTSMAAPHVAGAMALYLEANPTATPADLAAWVTGNATPGVVSDRQGSPNLLLYTLFSPPTGSITITMTPAGSTTVPACGGSVAYTYTITNTTSAPLSTDAWIYATGPSGQTYGPLAGPNAVTIAAGASLTYNLTQTVPGRIPAGTYTMIGAYGPFSTATDSDSFTLTKTTTPCRAGELGATTWSSSISQ